MIDLSAILDVLAIVGVVSLAHDYLRRRKHRLDPAVADAVTRRLWRLFFVGWATIVLGTLTMIAWRAIFEPKLPTPLKWFLGIVIVLGMMAAGVSGAVLAGREASRLWPPNKRLKLPSAKD
jgi:hypothetical protein